MASKPIKIKILGDTSQFDAALSGMSAKTLGFGKVMAAAGVGIAAGFAAAGVGVFKIGESFDEAYDKIRVGTGATGEALTGLQDDFKAVVSSVPTDFGSASTAVADLNTRLGLSGQPLQDMSAQMLELSRITDTDLGANIESVTRLFGDFAIEGADTGAAMDQLFRASQATGIGVDQLSSQMTQFGAPLRALGFGFDESAAMLAKWEKEGVNAEAVLAGMKVGLGNMAKAGEAPAETMSRLVDEMGNVATDGEAMAIAVEAFGTRAGPDMAMAVREGRFELDELMATIENGGDTIMGAAADTQSFGEKWTMFKNRVLVALEPIAIRVFNFMGEAMDYLSGTVMPRFSAGMQVLQEKWEEWGPKVEEVVNKVKAVVVPVFETIQKVVERVLGAFGKNTEDAGGKASRLADTIKRMGAVIKSAFQAVQAYVQTVVNIVTDLWSRFGSDLLGHLQEAVAGIIETFDGVLTMLEGVFNLIKAILTGKWGEAWDAVLQILSGAWETIKGVIQTAWAVIQGIFDVIRGTLSATWNAIWHGLHTILVDAWGKIQSGVSSGWNNVMSFLGSIPGRIIGLASSYLNAGVSLGRSIIDGLKSGISGAVSIAGDIAAGVTRAVTGAINGIIDRLNQGIPNSLGAGPFSIDLPDNPIPRLARGGYVGSGTVMVGERGPELVNLPKGSKVNPNHASDIGGVTVNVQSQADPHQVGREVAWAMKTAGR